MQCLERHGTPSCVLALLLLWAGWWGWVCVVCSVVFVGGFSGGVTPGPFPNPEAKPACADGTAPGRVWESRSPPAFNLWLLRSWLLMILGIVGGRGLQSFLGGVSVLWGMLCGSRALTPGWGPSVCGGDPN